ncbi:MAG: hypothetical protein E7300_07575 [Lachnospiraceae bacterium]|nr:hypothetical protein [Lachnospiraceae bacterium]
MDNFMEKLAQRFNASEIIKANSQAEAKEIEKLRRQIAEYDQVIQQMRQLHLKNAEMTETFRKLVEQAEQNAAAKKETEDPEEIRKREEELRRQSEDFMHKESVKVYRNVQAAVKDELQTQTADLMVAIEDAKAGRAATLVFAILAFLLGAANLTLLLLQMFHIL